MSRADATAEANRLRANGASVQEINNKLLGFGVWTDKNGKTEIYKAYNQGNNKIQFKVANQIRSTKNKEETKRQSDLKLSNKHLKKNQLAIAEAIKTANKAKGLQTDHIIERQTSGPVIRQLQKEQKLGLITKQELKNQLKIVQSYGIGDDPQNLQGKSAPENKQKADEVKAKNKSLMNAEKKNLSKRYGKLTFKQLFSNKNGKNGNGKNGNGKNGNGRSSFKAINGRTKSTDGLEVEELFESKTHLSPFGPVFKGV
tara:strand:+ start:153 stop:923 length:771 start_codon:yes stop_codon:yes gene_type:complete